MPDVPDREEIERRLGRRLSQASQEQLERVRAALGNPPNVANIPPDVWAGINQELYSVLSKELQRIYLDQAAVFVADSGIGIDWALINQRAADWASTYSFELVSDITDSTRTLLQGAVDRYYRQGQTMEDLFNAIEPSFGPVRSEMISVTEVTRAASEAEQAAEKEILAENPNLVSATRWRTNNDDLVCPICGPRNGKQKGDGWTDPPPAHPRCRCWITTRFTVKK
jgi:hypothetical protein